MKLFFLATVPLFTAFLGYLLSIKYAETKDFWDKFIFWHQKFKSEIAFSKNSLKDVMKTERKKDLFLTVAENFFSKENSGKNVIRYKFISDEEYDFLRKYLCNLGISDSDSQIDFLNSIENDLKRFAKNAEDKYKKYKPLYVKLGFLLGLILFILII